MDNLLADILVFATMCSVCAQIPPGIPSPPPAAGDGSSDYLDLRPDGGFRFGYNTGDFGQHQHAAVSSPDGRVAGRYSERGRQTIYTAGPRGFRARGTHIARRMDLSQNRIPYNPPVSPDSPAYQPTYSGYHDPNEDPSYSFGFRTPTYSRQETSNRNAEVTGQYSYLDDVGERHHVDYIAGSRTGFHVKTPFPDSLPFSGSLFVHTPGKPGQKARGRTAIQRGLDGSYRFTAAGPDQRRVEVSDATGHVRGSYTYLDDKGVQRTTEYIAGPNIGYKVINSKKGPLPSLYPYLTPTFPPALPPPKGISGRPIPLDDVFDPPEGLTTAETGPGVKPPKKGRPNSDESIEDMSLPSDSTGVDAGKPSKDDTSSGSGDDDFLLSISDINGGYEKPTSSYGSSEEPSGKPGNEQDQSGNGFGGGGYVKPENNDDLLGFVKGGGISDTNMRDDLFEISPTVFVNLDNISGDMNGNVHIQKRRQNQDSLYGSSPPGYSRSSDPFGLPRVDGRVKTQQSDVFGSIPSRHDSPNIGSGHTASRGFSRSNSGDDVFGGSDDYSRPHDSGMYESSFAGQRKPDNIYETADGRAYMKPEESDTFGLRLSKPQSSRPRTGYSARGEQQDRFSNPLGQFERESEHDYTKLSDDLFRSSLGNYKTNGAVRDSSYDLGIPQDGDIFGGRLDEVEKPKTGYTTPVNGDTLRSNFGEGSKLNSDYRRTSVSEHFRDPYASSKSSDYLFNPSSNRKPVGSYRNPAESDIFGSHFRDLGHSEDGYINPTDSDLFGSVSRGQIKPHSNTGSLKPSDTDLFGDTFSGFGRKETGVTRTTDSDLFDVFSGQVGEHRDAESEFWDKVIGQPNRGGDIVRKPTNGDIFGSTDLRVGNPYGDFPGSDPSRQRKLNRGFLGDDSFSTPLSGLGKPMEGFLNPGDSDIFGSIPLGVNKGSDDFINPADRDLFATPQVGFGRPKDGYQRNSGDDIFGSITIGASRHNDGLHDTVTISNKPSDSDLFGSSPSRISKPNSEHRNTENSDLFGSVPRNFENPLSGPSESDLFRGIPEKFGGGHVNPSDTDLFGSSIGKPGGGLIKPAENGFLDGTSGISGGGHLKPTDADLFGSTPGRNGGGYSNPSRSDLLATLPGNPGNTNGGYIKPTDSVNFGTVPGSLSKTGGGYVQPADGASHGSAPEKTDNNYGKAAGGFIKPTPSSDFFSPSGESATTAGGSPTSGVGILVSNNGGSSFSSSSASDNDGDDDLFGKPGGGYQRPGSGYGKPGGGITKPNKDGGDVFGGSPEFDTSTKNGYASSGGGYSKSDDQSSSLSSSSGSEDSVDDDLFGNPTNGFFKPTMGGGMVIGKKHKPGPTYTEIDDIYRPTPTPFDQIGVTTTNSGSPGSKTDGATDTKNTDGRIKVLFGNCCSVPSRGSIKHQKPTLKPTIVPPQLTSASYSNVRDFSYNHDGQALVSYHGTRDSYVGFPPGVAVRAHVQSLDILPYGHRLPSPTVALEQHSAGQGRRSSDSQQF